MTRGELYAVVTMRGIRESKSRLAGAVSAEERAALNRWLLERTLRVVRAWLEDMERCVFVSPCEEALALARAAGAEALPESGGAGGHNHAAGEGATRAMALGARTIVMLPCDLPELSQEALEALVAQAGRADFVIAPDEEGTGTNALVVPAAPPLQFFFGPGSLARYVEWGRSRGWRTAVHAEHALAFDLDTPAHLQAWRTQYHSPAPHLTRAA
ncbi:MAG TPA: 2-phospho-L-lactate guanylyltransferase [Burkholderiales bacterium]|nr:2-phospho-L-lactate guanylyltransferase [Burkholderiales bacterium]